MPASTPKSRVVDPMAVLARELLGPSGGAHQSEPVPDRDDYDDSATAVTTHVADGSMDDERLSWQHPGVQPWAHEDTAQAS